MKLETLFSPDRRYRYTLWRQWWKDELFLHRESVRYAMFIGLNPSTADEKENDATIRKCMGFAQRWGYDALCMTNLFAFRATDPKVMKREGSPTGLENQHHLLRCAAGAGIVVAAWGVNGAHAHMDLTVQQWMRQAGVTLHYLRLTKKGHPEHPLYLPYSTVPKVMELKRAA